MDPAVRGLRVLREVAERGTFTGAAAALGYTQSAVSRQVAALERAAGARLFDRRPDGVRLTPQGLTLLRHAAVALDALDSAQRALADVEPAGGVVRLGAYISAGAVLVPRALAALRRARPDILIRTREGTTPTLVRAVRAGTLDLAILSSRPPHRAPDTELPALELETLADTTLLLAVPAGSLLATQDTVRVEDFADQEWIATNSRSEEPLLGVWPGLAGRPVIAHTARDWLTKLNLVAAGCGITTIPGNLRDAVPAGVRVLTVLSQPPEARRILLARLPGPLTGPMAAVAGALATQAEAPNASS